MDVKKMLALGLTTTGGSRNPETAELRCRMVRPTGAYLVNPNARLRHERNATGTTARQQRKARTLARRNAKTAIG